MNSIEAPEILAFGQPVGSVVQLGYVVTDIYASIKSFTKLLDIGPWFLFDPYVFRQANYLGEPAKVELKIALAFSGHMNVELIQQVNDAPSMYRATASTGGGFHHYGIGSRSFDADVDLHVREGGKLVFSATTARGNRLAYLEPSNPIFGMLEVIEFTKEQEDFYERIHNASANADRRGEIVRL